MKKFTFLSICASFAVATSVYASGSTLLSVDIDKGDKKAKSSSERVEKDTNGTVEIQNKGKGKVSYKVVNASKTVVEGTVNSGDKENDSIKLEENERYRLILECKSKNCEANGEITLGSEKKAAGARIQRYEDNGTQSYPGIDPRYYPVPMSPIKTF